MQFDWMVQCYAGDGVHRDTPLVESLEREDVLHGADAAVEAGLEGLWAPDHFMLGPHAQEYEVWTILTTLAERTDDADIGSLVNSVTYRNPALLGKMATTLDILSEGRLRLGLGAGWHEEEHAAYGFEEYLEAEGRDPGDVERSWLAHVLVCEDEQTLSEYEERIFPLPWGEESDMDDQLEDAEDARRKGSMLIGTPAQVAEQIEAIEALGFEKLQLMFLDFPETRGMELFGDEVAPEFQ